MAKVAISGHGPPNELECSFRKTDPTWLVQEKPSAHEAADHEPIPVRQDLVIKARSDAGRPVLQEPLTRLSETLLQIERNIA
jgi:hypothetical protein